MNPKINLLDIIDTWATLCGEDRCCGPEEIEDHKKDIAAVIAEIKRLQDLDEERNCSACAYWQDAGSADIPGRFKRICGHPAVGGDYNTVSKEHAEDGANSYSAIATGPYFGCIHCKSGVITRQPAGVFIGNIRVGTTDGPIVFTEMKDD